MGNSGSSSSVIVDTPHEEGEEKGVRVPTSIESTVFLSDGNRAALSVEDHRVIVSVLEKFISVCGDQNTRHYLSRLVDHMCKSCGGSAAYMQNACPKCCASLCRKCSQAAAETDHFCTGKPKLATVSSRLCRATDELLGHCLVLQTHHSDDDDEVLRSIGEVLLRCGRELRVMISTEDPVFATLNESPVEVVTPPPQWTSVISQNSTRFYDCVKRVRLRLYERERGLVDPVVSTL
jgi:hypothetical protein